MNDSEDVVGDKTASETESKKSGMLRWWPAAFLVLVMVVLRSLLFIVESPPLPMMLVAFMGSGVCGLLILLWWLFASRATLKEKLALFAGFLLVAVVLCGALHPSLQGMGIMLFVLPTGCAAFAIGAILTASRQGIRKPVVLLSTFLGFGIWSMLQVQGFDGKFKGDFRWRWQPTDEDEFLASISDRKKLQEETTSAEEVLLDPEWPGFRGKDRTSVVEDVVLSEDWENNPPKEIWRTAVGPGWSSFSIAGDRLFTQEQRGESEAVICLDTETGAIVWEYEYTSRFWESIAGAGPRATPTIHSDSVFALGGEGVLSRLNAKTGEEIWKRDLKVDANREPPTWGFAASPLVIDSVVIVHAGGEGDKGILAYEVDSGEIAWSRESGLHSYSSAQKGQFTGVSGILMSTDIGVQFLSPTDGELIWQYDWKQEDYRVVQPLVFGDSILVGASLGTGARRITVTKNGDIWDIVEDWDTRNLKPDFNDSVLYDGYVYGFDSGIFCCIDLETGDRAWKRGRYGNGQVLLLADQGQLLVISEKGRLVLIEASPDKLLEVGSIDVFEGKTWNHPVLVGSRLYLRNAQEAACYEVPVRNAELAVEL